MEGGRGFAFIFIALIWACSAADLQEEYVESTTFIQLGENVAGDGDAGEVVSAAMPKGGGLERMMNMGVGV